MVTPQEAGEGKPLRYVQEWRKGCYPLASGWRVVRHEGIERRAWWSAELKAWMTPMDRPGPLHCEFLSEDPLPWLAVTLLLYTVQGGAMVSTRLAN